MWVEKYRPKKLEDVVNQTNVKERLGPLLEKPKEMPHLLFAGPPGTGKTTTALIIAQTLLGENWNDYTLSLNGSDERGIDIVRNRIKTFARYVDRRQEVPFRLVILDESDEMCLHPDTRVLIGKLDNLREVSLRELLDLHADATFDIPSFSPRAMRLEDDRGKIVLSAKAELFRISFEDGRTVLASASHPFFAIGHNTVMTVRTRDLEPGSEIASFSNRFLRCYNCSKRFYRADEYRKYSRHFCSVSCRNSFLASFSDNRTAEERREIQSKAIAGALRSGYHRSEAYRRKRSEIARRLIEAGRIPNPRTWTKHRKGERPWLGKKLSDEHKRKVGEGDIRYFKENPKVMEEKMARLLESWKIPYERERLTLTSPKGNKCLFPIDFVIGENIALLVNGCWWHVCPTCGIKAEYEKQRRNLEKDYWNLQQLERLGYKIVVVWEHELQKEESVQEEVLPRIFEVVGVSGGPLRKFKHSKVKSVEKIGFEDVLNISVEMNKNFLLANGILTHNTHDAQTSLRRIMEETSKDARFILIANFSSGIIEPLQSRCAIFRFQNLSAEDVASALREISHVEKLKVSGERVFDEIYEATRGDLRQAINLMQAASANGELTLERLKLATGTTVKARVADIIKTAIEGDFDEARLKLIELTRVYGIPEKDFLKFANEELNKMRIDGIAEAIRILAEYDYRLVSGAQPELQLTAMLAELSILKREKKGR
jgi:DNA polymerase III delta prime subunit